MTVLGTWISKLTESGWFPLYYKRIFYDCNITEEREKKILEYVREIIEYKGVDIFINSHRDADHMRGIKKLHNQNLISEIWDSGVAGTSTDSDEYKEYMELRRVLKNKKIDPLKRWKWGEVVMRYMNSHWDDVSEINDQSIVLKFEYGQSYLMLAGDTSKDIWINKIEKIQ